MTFVGFFGESVSELKAYAARVKGWIQSTSLVCGSTEEVEAIEGSVILRKGSVSIQRMEKKVVMTESWNDAPNESTQQWRELDGVICPLVSEDSLIGTTDTRGAYGNLEWNLIFVGVIIMFISIIWWVVNWRYITFGIVGMSVL